MLTPNLPSSLNAEVANVGGILRGRFLNDGIASGKTLLNNEAKGST